MYCTGLRKCKLLIWLSADDHKFVDVFYDETYIINHVNRLRNWWFSPGTLASSTTKTGRHDIAEILLKVALNTKNQ
jgi:hypothetical protein